MKNNRVEVNMKWHVYHDYTKILQAPDLEEDCKRDLGYCKKDLGPILQDKLRWKDYLRYLHEHPETIKVAEHNHFVHRVSEENSFDNKCKPGILLTV